MTWTETKHSLNTILEVIGSRGLSGVKTRATSLYDALEEADAFPVRSSKTERQALVANLRRQGLLEVTTLSDGLLIQPSVKAVHRLQRSQIDKLFIQPQKTWDGTWRMVSYDIPARFSKQRRLMTSELHRLGFSLVKDSMWFHPYPCFDVISELTAYCGLTHFVMIAEVARLDEATLGKLLRKYPGIR